MMVLFDLDRTLFRVNTSFRFGRYLFAQKILPLSAMLPLLLCYCAHVMGWMGLATLHCKSIEFFFKGRSLIDLERWAEEFFDRHFEEILNPAIASILRQALVKGEFVAILSSSPLFLVQAAARRFGVNACLATEYQVDEEGRMGPVTRCVEGKDKASYVEKLSLQMRVPLIQMVAYSDSHLDLPFLEAVGVPVAVNPTHKLRQVATKRQWVIVE